MNCTQAILLFGFWYGYRCDFRAEASGTFDVVRCCSTSIFADGHLDTSKRPGQASRLRKKEEDHPPEEEWQQLHNKEQHSCPDIQLTRFQRVVSVPEIVLPYRNAQHLLEGIRDVLGERTTSIRVTISILKHKTPFVLS
ncbi:hypothetical protein KFL_001660240 [Klebsormidium nitens]|uniref:Uncharacterized protein n=1 Tax=Klebsormidium nitens TaxID=105231 RepID=A0A1Y1I3A1_KLENI|nr:hypothetical protein KFL_001660240 [Klebsormidium nitens]|eukprot:GAQ83889.1 hypothetical protein KFL_001660240 [Klebsormidium nitens]